MLRTRLLAALGATLAVGCDSLADEGGELATCEVPSDCSVVFNDCCGFCGQPEPADVSALNVAAVEAHQRRVCKDGTVGCPGIACFPQPPSVLATCEAGRCAIVELAQHAATACGDDSDCRIRNVSCCECNASLQPGTLVAVSDEAAYTSLVCDPAQACDDCAPIYPMEVTAVCEQRSCQVMDPRMF